MGDSSTVPIVTPWRYVFALFAVLALFAMVRPVDHDESQYVASAVLVAHGHLPFRDFAWLQTPLQPFLFAPVAWIAGTFAWPVLRLVNAALGVVIVASVWRAAREAGAGPRAALAAAGLLAACDILLFSVATARNDAVPAALLALALIGAVRAERGRGSVVTALLVGLLLAAATAAKISYAFPAAAYGVYALIDRRHRPLWVAAGALPMVAFVGWTWALAPQAFVFGVLTFPARAPAEYYTGHWWKMSYLAKAVDALKFLALGPALMALVVVRHRLRQPGVVGWLVIAGLIAGLLPFPTWRQYLLPILPPLFVLLALAWDAVPPGRNLRIFAVVTICAGLAATVEGGGKAIGGGVPMLVTLQEGAAIRALLDAAGVRGPVATLSPEFLPAAGRLPDPRFADGPFYYRIHALSTAEQDVAFHAVSGDRPGDLERNPPQAILIGGEAPWTSGDIATDAVLERWALTHGYRALSLASARFRLYVCKTAPARSPTRPPI